MLATHIPLAPEANTAAGSPAIERLTYSAREAASAIGVSMTALWRLQKRGLLTPVPGMRRRIYAVSALRRFVERGAA